MGSGEGKWVGGRPGSNPEDNARGRSGPWRRADYGHVEEGSDGGGPGG